MAKNKERKKKERERRVAQQKLAAALKRVREKSAREAASPKAKKSFAVETRPKTEYEASNKRSPFLQDFGGM